MMTRSGRFSNTPRIVSRKLLTVKSKYRKRPTASASGTENQAVIIRVLVDKADVQENQYNSRRPKSQPHRRLLLRLKMRELFTRTTSSQLVRRDGDSTIKTRSTTS